jgi:hypothetical protein
MYKALIPGAAPSGRVRTVPLVTIPACPGCGAEHAVSDTFGRPLRRGEVVDVNLTNPPPEVPPRIGHDRGMTKVPDAEVLAAIPTARPALASDITRALGLSHTETLIRRVEHLNVRAVAAWGHPVVQIISADTGRRERYLQRNGAPSPSREYHRAPNRTDAEIIAAIPTDWTPATDVADTLGYSYPSLKNRLYRIGREGESGLETRLVAHRLQVKSAV